MTQQRIQQRMGVGFVLYFILQLSWIIRAASSDCRENCGVIDIRFPFGIKKGCYPNSWFKVTCNQTSNGPKPFISRINLELLCSSFQGDSVVAVNNPVTYLKCGDGGNNVTTSPSNVDLRGSPFFFSSRFNLFGSVGCGNLATVFRNNETTPISSCLQKSCGDLASTLDSCYATISENFTSYTASMAEIINPGSKGCTSIFLFSTLLYLTLFPVSSDQQLPPFPSLEFIFVLSINTTHVPAVLEWNPCDLEDSLCDEIFKGLAQPYVRVDGCAGGCGNVDIPYPFGIEVGCYMNDWFRVTCNETIDGPKPYITSIGLQLLSVSIWEGTIVVNNSITYSNCFKRDGEANGFSVNFTGTPFFFSAFYNRFMSVGCGSLVIILRSPTDEYPVGGCLQPICGNGTSDDAGCTTYFRWDLSSFAVNMKEIHPRNASGKSCRSAFIVDQRYLQIIEHCNVASNWMMTHAPVTLQWSTKVRGMCDCSSGYMYSTINHEYIWTNLGKSYLCVCTYIADRDRDISTDACQGQSEEEVRSLVNIFLLSMKGHSLLEIVDPMVMNGGPETEIVAVAKLAKRCLNLNGKKRPTMKEVAMELEQIRSSQGANGLEQSTEDDSDIDGMNEPSGRENPEEWITTAQNFFEFYEIQDHQRIIMASSRMEGIVKKWFRWMERWRQLAGWDHFVDAIRKRFAFPKMELRDNIFLHYRSFSTNSHFDNRSTNDPHVFNELSRPKENSFQRLDNSNPTIHQVFDELSTPTNPKSDDQPIQDSIGDELQKKKRIELVDMGSLDFISGNTIDCSSEDVPKVLTCLDKANDYISKVDNPNNESTVQHLAEMMTKICTMVSGELVLESPTMDVICKEFHGKKCDDIDKISIYILATYLDKISKNVLKMNEVVKVDDPYIFRLLVMERKVKRDDKNLKVEDNKSRSMNELAKYLFQVVFILSLRLKKSLSFLKNTLMDNNLQWPCHCYSTRVYRDCKGIYVVEDYSTNPTNEMVKLRLAAEQGWLNLVFDVGFKAHVFRLGDICQALKDNICTQLSKRNYHIKDDDPTSWKKVFAYALDLVEKKWHCPAKKITWHESVESFVPKASFRGEKQATATTLTFINSRDIAAHLTFSFSSSRTRSNILIRLKQIAAKAISSIQFVKARG
ncbi:hypothetical protein GQ457_13G028600 [Hibiscus cannabinus]